MKKIIFAAIAALVAPLVGNAAPTTYSFSNDNLGDLAHGTAYTWGLSGSVYSSLLGAVQSGQTITSATLTISNIYDWTVESKDVLYVNILSGLATGTSHAVWDSNPAQNDTSYGANPFTANSAYSSANATIKRGSSPLLFNNATTNSLLNYTGPYETSGNPGTWSDPYGAGSHNSNYNPGFDLVINFTAANLSVLQAFLAADIDASKSNVGLGFGPDCHYYDSGVCLNITTSGGTTGHSAPDAGSTLALLGLAMISLLGVHRRWRLQGGLQACR